MASKSCLKAFGGDQSDKGDRKECLKANLRRARIVLEAMPGGTIVKS